MSATRSSIARPLRQVFQLAYRPATLPPPFLLPFQQQHRDASGTSKASRKAAAAAKKKKKARSSYAQPDLAKIPQFSLLDAMRYLKAAEVGQAPLSAKYEIHIRLKTLRNGPVVRNRVRLPHPVKTDIRIAVVCPPEHPQAQGALKAGAVMVGEESIFDPVKEGKIDFDRLICHPDSLPKLQQQGLGRVLGPRGLMPSAKTNTVLKDVAAAVRDIAGASLYRERRGVINMAVGQLGYTPEELQRNIKAFIDAVKKDFALLSENVNKDIHEVVLSSTRGPGLSLNGELRGVDSPTSKDLSVN